MKKTALLFVGQGAQSVGMGKDIYADFGEAKKLFDNSAKVLDFDLSKIMFDGPQELLTESKNAQPALFLHAYCLYTLVRERLEESLFLAGHSLGEYTAFAASGALAFEEALRLVRIRGELMSEAGKKTSGKMAAIVGMEAEDVESACSEVKGVVVPANYNSSSQTVVSGEAKAVERAVDICRGKGAKNCVFLEVSAAFHSPLMEEAAREFSVVIDSLDIERAKIPVVANVSAMPVSSPDDIKKSMKEQMTGPVRWMQTVKFLKESGVERTIEFSTKPVLSSLVRKTEKDIETLCVSGSQSVRDFLRDIESGG
ncbi:ACP S-malonyltransferase [candidate division WOR-3 bacterium]|nr:ACP S-malonyltransferase [candidate division WOR-3 bacterium]